MNWLQTIFCGSMLLCMTACYPGISGRVIDAKTRQPIEGARIIVLWPEDNLFGDSPRAVHSYSEVETESSGQFAISGKFTPFVDAPEIIIYKRGYIVWRNDFVFPGSFHRTDYDGWQSGHLYKLEPMPAAYSREGYRAFLRLGMYGFGYEQSVGYTNMIDEIERDIR